MTSSSLTFIRCHYTVNRMAGQGLLQTASTDMVNMGDLSRFIQLNSEEELRVLTEPKKLIPLLALLNLELGAMGEGGSSLKPTSTV